MKATDIFKTAVEKYRDEVSGKGVEIDIPEIGMNFYVFPQQPNEGMYMMSGSDPDKEFNSMIVMAIRMICARAKTKDGVSLFDNEAEREKLRKMMMETMPSAFTSDVAARVISEIHNAFPLVSIEEAGNESEDAASSDSTSA